MSEASLALPINRAVEPDPMAYPTWVGWSAGLERPFG
jgi:hypothetical protein